MLPVNGYSAYRHVMMNSSLLGAHTCADLYLIQTLHLHDKTRFQTHTNQGFFNEFGRACYFRWAQCSFISFWRSFLPLVVSVCFSSLPEPDKELVEKYTGLKEVFLKRLVTAYGKFKDAIQPLLESSPTGEKAKEVFEELKQSPRVESAVKIIRWGPPQTSHPGSYCNILTSFIPVIRLWVNLLRFVCFFQWSGHWARACRGKSSLGSSRCLWPLSPALRWRTPGRSNHQRQASAGYRPASWWLESAARQPLTTSTQQTCIFTASIMDPNLKLSDSCVSSTVIMSVQSSFACIYCICVFDTVLFSAGKK